MSEGNKNPLKREKNGLILIVIQSPKLEGKGTLKLKLQVREFCFGEQNRVRNIGKCTEAQKEHLKIRHIKNDEATKSFGFVIKK